MGSSSGKLEPRDKLECKDWKWIESKDKSLVVPLNLWITEFKFKGKLTVTDVS